MVVKLLSEGKLALSVRYASEGMVITGGRSDITEMAYSWFASGSEADFLKSLETVPEEYEIEINLETNDGLSKKFERRA